MSKILLISASPRNGNTDYILQTLHDRIDSDKELIFLKDKKISRCRGCLLCHNKPDCSISDDMEEIRAKMIASDIFIIGTPNYFDNVSGLMKDFMDRTHPFYKQELLKDKKVIFIYVGGGKIEGTKKYLDTAVHGFVKYLKLELLGSFAFEALEMTDVKNDSTALTEIGKIVELCNIK